MKFFPQHDLTKIVLIFLESSVRTLQGDFGLENTKGRGQQV